MRFFKRETGKTCFASIHQGRWSENGEHFPYMNIPPCLQRGIFISIVIVTLNTERFIKKCLESIYCQSYREFEVIVVDNGSRDETVRIIISDFPQVRLIRNKENIGFCRANNLGIKTAIGEAILTLNSDIVLEKDFLENLIKTYQNAKKDIGMFATRILNWNGKTIDSTGLILTRARRFYDRGYGKAIEYKDNSEIIGPCAAAALYKREMLEDIKINDEYFDEKFFFLVEDVDIAWRAKNRSWRVEYVPEAKCFHYRNSTNFNRNFRQYLSFRNRYYLILKNESKSGLIKFLPFFCIYDIPRFLYLLLTNKHHTILALKELFKNSPAMLNNRKRRIIES
ncbi:MAG: glycosyltransferase family 2 protein [Candidatus Omnitrophota bacterium]